MNSPITLVKRAFVLAIAAAALLGAASDKKPADRAETLKRIGQAAAYVDKALDDVTKLLPPEKVPDIHPKSISLALAVAFLRAHTEELATAAEKPKLDDQFDAIATATLKLFAVLRQRGRSGSDCESRRNQETLGRGQNRGPRGSFRRQARPAGVRLHHACGADEPDSWNLPDLRDGAGSQSGGAFQVAISEQTNTVSADIQAAAPLQAGVETNALLHLRTDNGKPVPVSDLMVVHTQPIHLLVIDRSLGDYHHIHPKPTSNPGEYAFSFIPRKPGPYQVYADIVPLATGRQEYARADLPSAAEEEKVTNKETILESEVEDLTYTLTFNREPLVRGEPLVGKLHIARTSDHRPFMALEPLMGVFAHFVGFHEDHESLIHIHPLGPDPVPVGSHGGPDLDFQFIPLKSGFVRFFAQVQIGGADKFVPFQLNFRRAKKASQTRPFRRPRPRSPKESPSPAGSGHGNTHARILPEVQARDIPGLGGFSRSFPCFFKRCNEQRMMRRKRTDRISDGWIARQQGGLATAAAEVHFAETARLARVGHPFRCPGNAGTRCLPAKSRRGADPAHCRRSGI